MILWCWGCAEPALLQRVPSSWDPLEILFLQPFEKKWKILFLFAPASTFFQCRERKCIPVHSTQYCPCWPQDGTATQAFSLENSCFRNASFYMPVLWVPSTSNFFFFVTLLCLILNKRAFGLVGRWINFLAERSIENCDNFTVYLQFIKLRHTSLCTGLNR